MCIYYLHVKKGKQYSCKILNSYLLHKKEQLKIFQFEDFEQQLYIAEI